MSDQQQAVTIFHVADAAVWAALSSTEEYCPAAFAKEGFIHCCYESQLKGVLQRYYRSANNLVILSIARGKLKTAAVDENLLGGDELFPHIYGTINTDAITSLRRGHTDGKGLFIAAA